MNKMYYLVESYDGVEIPTMHSDATRALNRIIRIYKQALEERELGYAPSIREIRIESIEDSTQSRLLTGE